MFEPFFSDRVDAGKKFAAALSSFKDNKDTLILALPRGGIITGVEVAQELNLPFDIIIPRKIGAPHNPELAIGAIVEDEILLNEELIQSMGVEKEYIDQTVEKEKREIARRKRVYRKERPPLQWDGKTILLIDDGVATGSTIKAAILYLKKQPIKKLVVAIPVGPFETIAELKKMTDDVICLETPEMFMAVGQFYEKFTQTDDKTIIEIMEKHHGN